MSKAKLRFWIFAFVVLDIFLVVATSYWFGAHTNFVSSCWTDNTDQQSTGIAQNTTVTVLLHRPKDDVTFLGNGFLPQGYFTRYGSLTYDAKLVTFDENDPTQHPNASFFRTLPPPCLLVSTFPRSLLETQSELAPQCKTLLVNDEACKCKGMNARMYYHKDVEVSSSLPSSSHTSRNQSQPDPPLYLPVGPRWDFWKAWLNTSSGDNGKQSFDKASIRPLVFNAIFSKSTSPSRDLLKQQLKAFFESDNNNNNNNNNKTSSRSIKRKDDKSYFVKIAKSWSRRLNSKHLQSQDYLEVLLNSTFTLSPTGHNPECHRIYEAILAGSIPILVTGDDEYRTHSCGSDALAPLREAPMIFLDKWSQLEERIQSLLQDPLALNQRQHALQEWHHRFLRQHMNGLEEMMQLKTRKS